MKIEVEKLRHAFIKTLVPHPEHEQEMMAHPASTFVNNPRLDDPRCIEPLR
jgi:putative SOS response-associated peptidase YedK